MVMSNLVFSSGLFWFGPVFSGVLVLVSSGPVQFFVVLSSDPVQFSLVFQFWFVLVQSRFLWCFIIEGVGLISSFTVSVKLLCLL